METKKITLMIITLLIIFTSSVGFGQAYNGYTLFAPNNSKNTYLTNMSNSVVKTWTHTTSGGYSCYLLKDGSLMRSAVSSNSQLNGGGATGIVQKIAWNGTILWSYTYSSATYRSHHDICPMPNGNVLLIAWETKTAAQAVQAGLNRSAAIWPDHIVEIQPVGTSGGNIVWKWHAWDHLIQNYNPAKDNYGVVADHPELLNINLGGNISGDWMHINGITYNPELDQIAISSHNLDEIYVIDHSTTIAEAASHSGGRYGKGGDFLYRWGCPSNYGQSGAQVFNVVHSVVWVPKGLPGENNLMAFNNREGTNASQIVEITPPRDTAGNYTWTPGTAYGPSSPAWQYMASGFYSNHLGGVQRLPNGNTIIAESTSGYLFEVNQAGQTVWSYNRGGEVVRVLRYAEDYPGLQGLFPVVFSSNTKKIDFGDASVSAEKTDSIVIKNIGTSSLTINQILIENTNNFTTSGTAPLTVAANDSIKVMIKFKPESPGIKQGKIIFNHNGKSVSDTITLTGKGLGGKFITNSSSISLGLSQINIKQQWKVLIKNNGEAPLMISSVRVLRNSDYKVVSTLPVTIPVNDSTEVLFEFLPVSAGLNSARIVFSHNGTTSDDTISVESRVIEMTTLLPQFIQGINGTNSTRVPFVYRANFNGLLPLAVYRFTNQIVISTDAATTSGSGNCIFASPAGSFVRTSSPGMSTAGNYGSFTTDSIGSYSGWFVNEPTGNARFVPSNYIFVRIALNDGGTGTTVSGRFTSIDSVRVLKFSNANNDSSGTALRGEGIANPKDFIFLFDNTSGTGRPLTGTYIENDGTDNSIANNYAAFYANSVNGIDSTFGTIIPNNLPNGVRRIERRTLNNGSVAFYITNNSGVWPSGANTINPTGGTSEIVFKAADIISDVKNDLSSIPGTFILNQNYPNPFNPSTIISYSVPKESKIILEVFNTLGEKIRTLVNETKSPGNYSIEFNANDLPSGVYFYRLQGINFNMTKKLILSK